MKCRFLHLVGLSLLAAGLLAAGLLAAGLSFSAPLLATKPGPEEAIARLNYAGYRNFRHCTAVLTGPDRALTAAHCVNGIPYDALHLLRGYDRGEWLEHMRPTGSGADDLSRDVVTLCVGRDDSRPFVPVSRRPVQLGETVTVYGYGRPRVQVLNRVSCRITGRRPNAAFVLDCPLPRGASGAPALRAQGSGYEVVGIVSGSAENSSLIYAPGVTEECTGED